MTTEKKKPAVTLRRVRMTIESRGRALPERCEGCGRPFNGRSRPHWVFTPDAKSLGLMHAGCAARANPYRPGTDASMATEEEARFIAWTDLVERGAGPREDAVVMSWAVHPSLDPRFLSQNQMDWLKRRPPEQQRAIHNAYVQLLNEFREWRAGANLGLEPTDD